MEQTPTRQRGAPNHETLSPDAPGLVWLGHDELPPDDGRWLYVTDLRSPEPDTPGAWVCADLDPHQAVLLLGSLFGRLVSRYELAVTDQLGIEDMVDEDHFAPEAHR